MGQTYKEFAKREKIKLEWIQVACNPHMDDMPKYSKHYVCILSRLAYADPTKMDEMVLRSFEIHYSMGPGLKGKPTIEDLLDCVASESNSFSYNSSFEDWASEFGYDEDSRKAEQTYKVCKEQSEKLRDFLGSDLYWELLEETSEDGE